MEYLFKEGVLCVKKDGMKAKHDDIPVPNLHVMMVMKSLASKDYVKFKFNWRWFYYFLTDKGIEYLREVLHLPPQVFPATLTLASAMRNLNAVHVAPSVEAEVPLTV